ncbi:MAG: CDP-glycerol glycerophosphotransferase family protein [Saccharofermentans sp.]|nr:CDP-glycerol glycerophosphotransferase family protein [Saccharofermentans sp.]
MMLYIDPGTGSMLFTILIGVYSVLVFFVRSIFVKLKFLITSGKAETDKNTYKYVIFAEDKRYFTTFGPICDEFESRKIELVYITSSEDDPVFFKNYKYIKPLYSKRGNVTYSKMNLLKADIVLSTTPNLDVFQWKRSRDVKWYVHIFHAFGGSSFYRMFPLDMYDAVLLSGPVHRQEIRKYEELRSMPTKELIDTGMPYADLLYRRKLNAPAIHNEEPVVLLAPSWGVNSIFQMYGEKFVSALVNTGYHVIIRPHPQSYVSEKDILDKLMKMFPASDKLEWNTDSDNFDVLNRADILISDFSGIIFDFSLVFNKPVIYSEFEFDFSQYEGYWNDEEKWLLKTLKKIGKPVGKNFESELKPLIDSSLHDDGRFDIYEMIRKEDWVNIGESAKYAADYLINKQKELSEKMD